MRAPVPCIEGFRRIFSRSDKRSVMSLDVRIHRFTGRRDEGMFAKVRRALQLTMSYSLPTGVAIGLVRRPLFPSERHRWTGP